MSGRAAIVLLVVLGLAASAPAGARPKGLVLTPDQQTVAAAAIEDTFPRPRGGAPLALCLDVRVSDDPLEEMPAPARGGTHGKDRARGAQPVIQGAPPELVARLARPWRAVASASACRLDPREAYALDDARRTPARLVTVRLGAHVATGALRIDWTGGTSAVPGAVNSRDCTATHGKRGWTVRCGGTWSN